MPPHESPYHYTLFYLSSAGEARSLTEIKSWTIETGKYQVEDITTGGGSFTARPRFSRKKKSRRSDWWRVQRLFSVTDYRAERRWRRLMERIRRKGLKKA